MLRILCVDDDALVLAVTADLLRELGHEVVEAAGGSVAVGHIQAGSADIDMIVTDIHMPGGPGGLELVEYARGVRPGLPAVYFSGLSHVIPQGLDGAVLRKPCTLGELQQAVEGAVLH